MDGIRIEVAGGEMELREARQMVADAGVPVDSEDGELVFEFADEYLAGVDVLDRAGVSYEVRGVGTKEETCVA